jgi:hypothetical protein
MPSSTTNINFPNPFNIELGGDGTAINLDSDIDLTSNSTSTSTSTSNSTASLDLKVEPLDIKIEPLDLKIEPLKVDTDSKIDIKPLAVDSCTTIKLAPLPPIRLEQPYSTHFGFTYMGMELFGFNLSGKSATFLSSPPKPQFYSEERAEDHKPFSESGPSASAGRPRSGLRVRVTDK